jgi:hypothetical protein
VLLTGVVKGSNTQPKSEAVVSGMTFICTNSTVLLCYMFVTDSNYDNPFGNGNTGHPFCGNGFTRFLFQTALSLHTIVHNGRGVHPSVHLQIRSNQLAYNMVLLLGFQLSDPCLPPIDMNTVPLWLNGHMHLVSQNKSKELLFLCFFN